MTEPNDIPAILARAETWREERQLRTALHIADRVCLTDVPNMAAEILSLRARLREIAVIIESVDNRAMAADGPVTPTLQEMTQREMSRIYTLSRREKENG